MMNDNKGTLGESPDLYKKRLQDAVSKMSDKEYELFIKYLQFRMLDELLDNMSNLKQTTSDVWTKLLIKMKSIKMFQSPDPKIDINGIITVLLPLVGAFAAGCIGMKRGDEAMAEAAEDERQNENLMEIASAQKSAARDSVILGMCKTKNKGFSE